MNEDKKIIIDEDWKTQVEREKEELTNAPPESETPTTAPGEIPPATFATLVTSIGSQALMTLGQIADPSTGQAMYHPELARHHIDSLAILQEKTDGNLTEEEKEMLDQFIIELRQLWLAMQNANFEMPPAPGNQAP